MVVLVVGEAVSLVDTWDQWILGNTEVVMVEVAEVLLEVVEGNEGHLIPDNKQVAEVALVLSAVEDMYWEVLL